MEETNSYKRLLKFHRSYSNNLNTNQAKLEATAVWLKKAASSYPNEKA